MNTIPKSATSILVVDDTLANLQLLAELLQKRGYRARAAPSGKLALQAVQNEPPDLILLDINMPDMNGYEVCERLKAEPAWADIPVIFISALHETLDKVKAFAVGGVDYVTKPFQFEEVEARVVTHLELSRLRAALGAHNGQLEEVVRQRTAELAQAYSRLQAMDQAKSGYLSLISHELLTPLNGVLGLSDVAFDGTLPPDEMEEIRALFERAKDRLMGTLNDAMLLSQMETDGGAFALRPTALDPLLARARKAALLLAGDGQVTLAPPPTGLAVVLGNDELLQNALTALLKTAVKYAAPGSTVTWSAQVADGQIALRICATGHCVEADFLPDFWDVFAENRPATLGEEMGFGAAVAGRLITWMGGAAAVENLDPPGVLFSITLPASESWPQDLSLIN